MNDSILLCMNCHDPVHEGPCDPKKIRTPMSEGARSQRLFFDDMDRPLCPHCMGYKKRTFHERNPELVASLAYICGIISTFALASIMEWWK